MSTPNSLPWLKHPVFLNYGVAVLSVTAALFIALWMQIQYKYEPLTPFLCAIMFSAWFGGFKPGWLSVVLSLLAFHYYFLSPTYPFAAEQDIPRLLLAALTAIFIMLLTAAQWRATEALRESELRFRRLVELMPVAVYVCDTLGIIQSYNNRAIELWGREPKSGDTAQRYCGSLRLYSPDGKLVPHHESKMAEVLRTGVHARDLEVVIEQPDGSRISVLVNIAPLRNSDGELIGAINCFQDITESKRMDEELRDREAHLCQVLAERERLSRDLHDHVLQGIYAVGMRLEETKRQSPPHLAAPFGDIIANLNTVIRDIRGYISGSPQQIQSYPQFRAELEKLIEIAEGISGPRFELDADPSAFAQLTATEAEQALHIAREAVSNSMRHSQAAHGKLALLAVNAGVMLEIADDGIGFDYNARGIGGSGLRNMRPRARQIGARLDISSTPGSGARIALYIPKQETADN